MNETNSERSARMRWFATGVALGALAFGTVVWARGRMAPNPTASEMAPPASMQMDGEETDGEAMARTPETEPVQITPAQVRQFGITFGTVEVRQLESRLRTVGIVKVDETRLAAVTTKFPGYVDHLYADYTGKIVRKGAPLLDIYAPDLVAAQEEVLLARSLQAMVGEVRLPGVPSDPVDLEATARRRLSLWDIGDDQIDALLAEGSPSRTLSLSSPISGIVLEKSIVSGAAFDAGQALFQLADLSEVWIDIEIRERDAALVRPGSRAEVRLAAYPGETYAGTVDFVYPTADERTRSVRARVVILNPEGLIRPGMYATVQVITPQRQALSVPLDAVVWTGDRSLIFVDEGGGRLRPVNAQLGATVGEYVVVLNGVEEGQRVVKSAQYLIDAEANIGAIMRSMMGMMGAGDMGGMEGMDMGGMEMPADSSSADTTGGR